MKERRTKIQVSFRSCGDEVSLCVYLYCVDIWLLSRICKICILKFLYCKSFLMNLFRMYLFFFLEYSNIFLLLFLLVFFFTIEKQFKKVVC